MGTNAIVSPLPPPYIFHFHFAMALQSKIADLSRVPDVIKYYFEIKVANDTIQYTCNKCYKTPAQQFKTGYTNLRRHFNSCIGNDFTEKCKVALKSQQSCLGFAMIDYISERELIIFKWLKWVIMRDMAFTEADNQLTSELTGLRASDNICSKSVTTYIHALVPLVEVIIGDTLPTRFAIMFDGLKNGTTHYVAIFAEVLLGLLPPLDEQTNTAEAHRDLVVSVLSVYGKMPNDVVALIGDNGPTNKATANLLGINLLGCSCHKLNLAIGRLIESQPGLAKAYDSVATLASKANTLKSAAVLTELTELVAVRPNDTRWSSSYKMEKRVFEIEMELRQLQELEMPRQSDLQLLRVFMRTLAKLDSVRIGLQKQGLSIASALGTLNEILEDFSELSHYLAQDAEIVHNPTFESALAKLLDGRIGEM
ncbi:hypothetical protein PHMEG_00011816 [Phytophthora megakarya]|uniref:BED-type domain-containing protein n=1 Tax=Phytophthora megakarya TaxID=4795 RepID=A0A225WAU6_9STRA|nr:hypothetical protein PHMEG_00011816 [Phytophthora megakarya]